GARLAALGPALVVAASGVLVRGAGIERHELPVAELEPHGAKLERAEVDAKRVAVLAAQRRELVEQAGLGADPVVLHARAELRELDPVPGVLDQRQAERRLERGGRGEPGAMGEVALDLERRAADLVAGGAQLGDRAADEGAPAARARHVPDVERVLLVEIRG